MKNAEKDVEYAEPQQATQTDEHTYYGPYDKYPSGRENGRRLDTISLRVDEPVTPRTPPADYHNYGHAYEEPQYEDCEYHRRSLPVRFLFSVLYLFLSFAESVVAFWMTVAGVIITLCLLPICCLGAPVFQFLLLAFKAFATVDVELANKLSSQGGKIYLHPHVDSGFTSESPTSCMGRTFYLTPRSFGLIGYFGFVKLLNGALGAFAIFCGIISPICALLTWGGSSGTIVTFDYDEHKASYVAVIAVVGILGLLAIPYLARFTRKITRQFCGAAKDSTEEGRRNTSEMS